MALLDIEALSKAFGGVRAIADLDFTVEEHQVYSVIGPNGAGKTTLFNLLSGIYQADTGQIYFQEQQITGHKPYRIAAMGVSRTFQNLQIFFNMSVLDNVMVGCHLRTHSQLWQAALRLPMVAQEEQQAEAWAREALQFCGLEKVADTQASELPYGLLKRLEIARALATQPQLLMMDEPAAGLNDTETAQMCVLIRRICDAGTTVLLVEHNMGLVMQVSDRVMVLNFGKCLAEGTPAQIQSDTSVIKAYLGGGEVDGG